jgi:hypothetical protein
VGQPIGTGGAALGEPVSLSGVAPTVEVGPPLGTPALQILDQSDIGSATATFEFLGGAEPADEPVSISFWVYLNIHEDYIINVREQGGASQVFLNIRFSAAGQVFFSDASNSGNVYLFHNYSAATPVRIEMAFDPENDRYSIWWNGNRVVHRQEHGITARDVGSIIFGHGFDADLDGDMRIDALKVYTFGGLTPVEETPQPESSLQLQAAPNPFNPATEISFELPQAAQVRLEIYDSRGRLVRRLLQGTLPAGWHRPTWRGRDDSGQRVASGVYHALLKVDQETQRVAMTLIK